MPLIKSKVEKGNKMADSKTLQIRNSTIDFLTFTRQSGEESIEVRVQDNDVWLTQASIAKLFGVDRSVITKHLKSVFEDGEVEKSSVCANFAQTADDGKTPRIISINKNLKNLMKL